MNFKYSKELFLMGIISKLLSCNSLGLIPQKTQIEKNEEINNSPITSTSSQYPIVDTNQEKCFDVSGVQISCMQTGQDAQYKTLSPSFSDNNDGTVSDHITKLVWQQTADINGDGKVNYDDKMSQSDAISYCENLTLAKKSDWRLPDIKSIYSLIDFNGKDISAYDEEDSKLTPFINN